MRGPKIQKVLHGAPLGPDFVIPFGLNEVINPFEEVSSTRKKDERHVQCVVVPSQIDHPDAGEGCLLGPHFLKVTGTGSFVASFDPCNHH